MRRMTHASKGALRQNRVASYAARLGRVQFGCLYRAHDWDPFTDESRVKAVAPIHAALDAGVNYIDAAVAYGNGHSESIIGEAVEERRGEVYLATKVSHRFSRDEVMASIEASRKRLRTDTIDVIQFHGGMYTDKDTDHILNDGLLEALLELRDRGHVRFIEFTVEDYTPAARRLIETGQFEVIQVRYNLIYQEAALHALNDARKADIGVAVMRPTSFSG